MATDVGADMELTHFLLEHFQAAEDRPFRTTRAESGRAVRNNTVGLLYRYSDLFQGIVR